MRAGRGAARPGWPLPRRAGGGLRLSGGSGPPIPPPAAGGSPAQGGGSGGGGIRAGLIGAVLLARGDAGGLALIGGTPESALHSFRAALLCLPVFVLLRLLAWAEGTPPTGGIALGLAAELTGFVLAWAGFALASLPAAEAAQRRARWPLFVAAWNYGNVVQYAVLLLGSGVPMLLGLPGGVAQALGLVALGYVLWFEWFIARVALNVTGLQAAGFVLMDLAISVFVAGLVARLSSG